MATVINSNQVKLDSGKVVQASTGGWYDGQQFWNGTLSDAGQINTQSNQQGAGKAVSREVIAQTNPANVGYIDQKRQQAGLAPSPSVSAPSPSSLPGGSSSAGASSGLTMTQPETINLPKLYESLYASSGIRDIEAGLSEKTNQYNAAVAKIKDNPYLSEATMTGRISKLDQKFNADAQNIKNDIAMRKADVETKLNLESKQFDINSDVAKQAFSQFQSLLESGALDSAGGEDIANITRSTGLSSSMIQSAINANKAKNVKTSIIEYDDGKNQGFAIIDANTGNIINSQTVAASKPKATGGGGSTKATIVTDMNTDYGKYINNETITVNGKKVPIRKALSPEAFYRKMVANYPSIAKDIPKPAEIRKITGQ